MEWIEYFRGIAEQVKLKSKDPNTKIGAIIVGSHNEIVSTGYNSFPRGIVDSIEERAHRPAKYKWIEHAERNAIYNAAKIGVSTNGCTMYLTCANSCPDCARAIINSGIKTVIYLCGDNAKGGQYTNEDYLISQTMFTEAGVEVIRYGNV